MKQIGIKGKENPYEMEIYKQYLKQWNKYKDWEILNKNKIRDLKIDEILKEEKDELTN